MQSHVFISKNEIIMKNLDSGLNCEFIEVTTDIYE